jgi:hypothetical protein
MDHPRRWVVYVLIDPRDDLIRYVGVTVRSKRLRMNEHLSKARKGGQSYRDSWLRQLLDLKLKPKLQVIETVDESEWEAAEKRWIKHFKDAGARLTNLTDGGEGNPGYVPTPELRAKWSAIRKGKKYPPGRKGAMLGKNHDIFARAKISAAGIGRRHTDESKAKLSAAHKGKVLSQEHKAKLRAAKHGKTLAESHKRKIREAALGHQPVRHVSSGQAFSSVGEAARFFGTHKHYIFQALKKRCRSQGSYWARVNA